MRRGLRGAWNAICAVALSPTCATCGRPLDDPLDGAVCGACWAAVRLLSPPLCERCGYPVMHASRDGGEWTRVAAGRIGAASAGHSCLGCTELRVVDRARSLGAYEGVLRDVLHALKYSGRRSTAPHLARLLRERCADLLAGADAVVPVPLHPRRAWTRGFNQAALVAERLGLPVRHALRRRRHTAPQAGLAADDRARNVDQAFAPSFRALLSPSLVRGACLVLVDDVSTTGATLEACARVLKARGAREVRALTAARTLKGA